MIKVGDTLPATVLMEYSEVEGNGCSIGPNPVDVAKACRRQDHCLVCVAGRFHTHLFCQACSRLRRECDAFKAAGVDEIWCVSVNDAFVMGAWARDQKTNGKVRMLGDGSAAFAKATGLTLDLTAGYGPAQQPLFDAGQGRQGGFAEYRRSGQVRGQRCGHVARTGKSLSFLRSGKPHRSTDGFGACFKDWP
jgi:peroxiredoxin